MKYRVGLVGGGYIAEFHIAALRRLPNIELAGIYDLDTTKSQHLGTKHSVPVFGSLNDMARAGINVVHVLTPPQTHAGITIAALRLGCHVLVEKPLAESVEDCEAIRAIAAAEGLEVCVNHSLLFDPQVKRALSAMRSGKLGTVVSVDILRSSAYPPYLGGALPPQYRSAGYPFRDLGVHALYLLQEFLGPVENIEAQWMSIGGDPNLKFDEWRAQVRCRDGIGQVQLSWNVKPMQSQLIIQGTKGVLRVDLFLMFQALRASTALPKAAERIINAATDSITPLIEVPINVLQFLRKKILPYHGLQDLIASFYQALTENGPVPVPISAALPIVDFTERVAREADREYNDSMKKFKLSESGPILITGASGALGSALADRLVARGQEIRLFVRRPPKTIPKGVEIALGDLGDPEAVDRAVHGVQQVIHVGAAMKGGWSEHLCGTVTGTRNVLDACRSHNVKKLVHISSLSVVDWAGGGENDPISESSVYEPRCEDRGAYTRAKLEAEKLVIEYTKSHGIASVILRPGQIFGRRLPLLTPAIARRMGKRWIVLGSGRVKLPLVYIDDVVDAILAASESALADGEIIQLVDPEELTQNDVLRLTLGNDAPIIRVPRSVVFALGKASELLLGLIGKPSPISVYRLKSALANRKFQSDYAETLLRWEPRVGVCQGIRLWLSANQDL
jgi:predicted dehydrogenase/nucleoside-diphosphate-sugar epimerase